jgi:hypothetical protein
MQSRNSAVGRALVSVGTFLSVSVAWAAPEAATTSTPEGVETARVEFFEKKVRPVLVSHCYQCHSADTKPAGGLRADDRHGLLSGGDSGAAVVPGKVEESLIIQRIEHANPKRKMPTEGDPLTEAELADLKTWIADGAAWPRERIPAFLTRTRSDYQELKATHWAWQPLTAPASPATAQNAWVRDPVDGFILAAQQTQGLAPVKDADRKTLLRRIAFDLTGLPPAPGELEQFEKDQSPDAFGRVVDRLLASPQYAERWGRHWLDVARYGESTGPSRNIPYPHLEVSGLRDRRGGSRPPVQSLHRGTDRGRFAPRDN